MGHVLHFSAKIKELCNFWNGRNVKSSLFFNSKLINITKRYETKTAIIFTQNSMQFYINLSLTIFVSLFISGKYSYEACSV